MYKNKKVGVIVQARMASTRLPGKVLLPLAGKPVLQHIIERIRRSQTVDDVIIATTTNVSDDDIVTLCQDLNCTVYRGSEEDVLTRVLDAAKSNNVDIIVEITGDCPCVCPEIIDEFVKTAKDGHYYISNVIDRTFPRGLDIQVFNIESLDGVEKIIDNPVDRQHVSTALYKNKKIMKEVPAKKINVNIYPFLNNYIYTNNNIPRRDVRGSYESIRLTLDSQDDYLLLNLIFNSFDDNTFNFYDILDLIHTQPEMFEINKAVEQKNYYKELAEYYVSKEQGNE